MVYCFFPSTPPAQAKSKGPKGVQQGILLTYQDAPHQFAAGLKDVACLEPGCCIASACCAPCGITACYSRKSVLEKYHNGMDDFVCCQNYIPKCCCIEPASMCRGSPVGLCLEGFCCPMFSLSIARMHLMDSKQIRPDPCDWQIIQCSNCLQLLSCIIDIAAAFAPELRDLALIIDLIADLFVLRGRLHGRAGVPRDQERQGRHSAHPRRPGHCPPRCPGRRCSHGYARHDRASNSDGPACGI